MGDAVTRAGTRATELLDLADVRFTVHRYRHDPRTRDYGAEAIASLDVDPERVFKTLMLKADSERALLCAVIPVALNLSLPRTAAAFGVKKVRLATPEDAQRRTGYVVGGISPLGQRASARTLIDDAALGYEKILVSAGQRGVDIELAAEDLARLTAAEFAHLVVDHD